MERQILCFGDSNTWGYNPDGSGRFPSNVRWTGLLQEALKQHDPELRVAEEGMNGRTTIFGEKLEPHRYGLPCVAPIIMTHKPLAAIIVMLGTNDTKYFHHASAREINMGMEQILREIHWACASDGGGPPILLMCPKPLNADIQHGEFNTESAVKSAELAPLYESTAAKYGCGFLDLGKIVPGTCLDGIHLNAEQHRIAADAIIEWVLSVIK